MGKLLDILEHAGKLSGGASFGFAGRTPATAKAKATAMIVSVATRDELEGIVKAGADAVVLPPELATEVAKTIAVAWGVDARGVKRLDGAALREWRRSGADFALLPLSAPARALTETVEHLDRVLVTPPPSVTEDPLLLGLRSLNFLRADAAILDTQLTAREASELTIEAMARLRSLGESVRFPVVLSLREVPAEEDLKTLVRLGVEGLWLAGGATAERVTALREALERIPREPESPPRQGATLGGLAAGRAEG